MAAEKEDGHAWLLCDEVLPPEHAEERARILRELFDAVADAVDRCPVCFAVAVAMAADAACAQCKTARARNGVKG